MHLTKQQVWDMRFFELALNVASWSKDPSSKVGAIIVDADRRIVSTGFNGLPRGVSDTESFLGDRDTKLAMTIHAEQNAILFASGRELTGCTIYTTHHPCAHCAATIIQVGITEVVCPQSDDLGERWAKHKQLAETIFLQSGVSVRYLHYN